MFKEKFEKRVNSKEDWISDWYWRRKYNSISAELELLKEVMRCDIYEKTIKQVSQPLELVRYKRENTRLRNLLHATREERNSLINEVKSLKKELSKREDER